MAAIQDTYKPYTIKEYKKRVLLGFAAWSMINTEAVFAGYQKYCKFYSLDVENEVMSKLRGFG